MDTNILSVKNIKSEKQDWYFNDCKVLDTKT